MNLIIIAVFGADYDGFPFVCWLCHSTWFLQKNISDSLYSAVKLVTIFANMVMMLELLHKFDQQFVWIATCCFQTYWCLICKLNKHCVCATCCGWFSKHFQRCIFLFKSVSCFWVQCSIRFLITKITHMYCCFLFIVTVVWERDKGTFTYNILSFLLPPVEAGVKLTIVAAIVRLVLVLHAINKVILNYVSTLSTCSWVMEKMYLI